MPMLMGGAPTLPDAADTASSPLEGTTPAEAAGALPKAAFFLPGLPASPFRGLMLPGVLAMSELLFFSILSTDYKRRCVLCIQCTRRAGPDATARRYRRDYAAAREAIARAVRGAVWSAAEPHQESRV